MSTLFAKPHVEAAKAAIKPVLPGSPVALLIELAEETVKQIDNYLITSPGSQQFFLKRADIANTYSTDWVAEQADINPQQVRASVQQIAEPIKKCLTQFITATAWLTVADLPAVTKQLFDTLTNAYHLAQAYQDTVLTLLLKDARASLENIYATIHHHFHESHLHDSKPKAPSIFALVSKKAGILFTREPPQTQLVNLLERQITEFLAYCESKRIEDKAASVTHIAAPAP